MTLQAALIAVVAVLAISFSSVVAEQFLVREALRGEAVHFWNLYEKDRSTPPPHTDNLKGYLSEIDEQGEIPEDLRGYLPGYHKMHGQMAHSLLYITERQGRQLYLLFDGESVLRLAIYFGIIPLTIVLVLIYIGGWWVYRESNFVLSPIVWLSDKFERFDPADTRSSLKDLSDIPGDVDWEIEKLVSSFRSYATRIQLFVERERAFTRDASHEFRTPLTVIKMASDLLLAEQELDAYSKKYVNRIKGAARDMEELIDAFLILARETDKEFDNEKIVVREIVDREIQSARIYLENKPVKVEVIERHPLQINGPRKVVAIVLGNLVRNAALYTNQGSVQVIIKTHSVEVADTGIGMTEEQVKKIFQPFYRAEHGDKTKRKGYGVGLTIVKRLSNRFNWKVNVQSRIHEGTSIEVVFEHDD